MSDSFVFKTERPWPNARLDRAVIVGHTTANSAKIWLRTGLPGSYKLWIYPLNDKNQESHSKKSEEKLRESFKAIPFDCSKKPKEVTEYEFCTDFSKDTTYVVQVKDLNSFTSYGYAVIGNDDNKRYRVLIGQDNIEDQRAYVFRTLSKEAITYSFGFYSCHKPYTQSIFGKVEITNMDMWERFSHTLERHYINNNLAFVIGGGDQVYVDGVGGLNIWKYLNKHMRKCDDQLFPDKEDMLSWYRDIYRGYWGFSEIKKIFSRYPNYMIWDDHELLDGCGSHFFEENDGEKDELGEILPDWKEKRKNLNWTDCQKLLKNMKVCAEKVYREYTHSHNPDTAESGIYDYEFTTNQSAFYFLDGRGHRDINRDSSRILGKEQINRFSDWLRAINSEDIRFVFLISAVPLLHLNSVVDSSENSLSDLLNLEDDFRDAWEHNLHNAERKQLIDLLFESADNGLKIAVLSGDVHVSAAFRLQRKNSVIYQLTSSAITYNLSRPMSWVLSKGVKDEGESYDGYNFKRLALYTDRNYALIKVNVPQGYIEYQLYGAQKISDQNDDNNNASPMTHSIMKLELDFKAQY